MANQSSSHPILCASFNQDNSCFVIGTRDGFKIFDCETGKLLHERGLCAFSASTDNPYLALPASTMEGSVLVYNVIDLQSHCEIHAHRSPLAAMAFSSNGMYIATASEQGTIIRVHLISEATKSYSFRRGTYPSTIFSLSFGPSADLPDILLATSSSGSVHIFSLGFDLNERATVSVITFSGYFQVYSFIINHKHEATWTLEHEVNLLTAVAEQ
ncbi:UNVERIFIED_CONTAM: Autophagy-related protein 18b [Sesamum indicum]